MMSLFTYVLQVCIKIESPGGDAPKMFGRHFDDKDMVISKVSSTLAVQKIFHIQDYTHFLPDLARVDRRVQGLVQRRPSEK